MGFNSSAMRRKTSISSPTLLLLFLAFMEASDMALSLKLGLNDCSIVRLHG